MEYDKSEIKSEYLERLLTELNDEKSKDLKKPDFVVITPEPGFCIKLHDGNKQKVFVNICTSEKIPRVKDIDDEKLAKLLDSINDFPDFRIPMSIGEPHKEKDHLGSECVCYDVAINPQFLVKMNSSPTIKGFFFCLCFEGIENKYDLTLTRDWKILQNKKAHGTIKEQYLRTSSKPVIIDCDDNSKIPKLPNQKPLITEVNENSTNNIDRNLGQRPVFEIVQVPTKGFPEYFVVEIQLPKIKSSKSLQLDVGENRVRLESRTKIYGLDFYLPEFIIPEKTLAEFNVVNKVLSLTLTVNADVL